MTGLSDRALDHLRRVADWPDLIGTRYEIVDRLGAGGMGTVYLAYDKELEREVALKVTAAFSGDLSADPRLLNEARILARLEHPGIIPVHDAGRLPDGRLFYAMKRVRGSRLDDYAQRVQSIAEALRLFERICDTVAFAHAQGIIHRDLKPQNVMVGSFGEVLILDWGVAKLRFALEPGAPQATLPSSTRPQTTLSSLAPLDPALSSSARLQAGVSGSAPPDATADGVVLGTPGYMAPEQARGRRDQLDQRADVYALGALLRFLLTGETPAPLPGESAEYGRRREPRRWKQSIPRPLEAICQKALASDPGNRYATAVDVSADVSRFLAHAKVHAHAETLLERAQRFASKHRIAVVLIAAYLVIRIALLLFGRH